jgi:hypothetical protein
MDIEKRLYEFNFDKPILDFYKGYFDICYVVLHPFYRKVFADNYNELGNFRLTYPLIERITWSEIIKRTEIADIKKLALAITYDSCNSNYQSLIKNEKEILLSFYESVDIVEPYWVEDRIPEDLIVLFFELLIKLGYTEIKVGDWIEDEYEKIEVIKLTQENKFENAVRFSNRNFILTPDNKYCLKLPYHDLPYTFLLTNEILANEIIAELNYEGFFANSKTEVYWHLDF